MSDASVSSELAALRILDACANRASEGLRTMEEFARFALEDRHLCEVAKQLRHDLQSALEALSPRDRLTARAVLSDCGTTIETTREHVRPDAHAVLKAAAGRTQESLRCIEEYGKTIADFDSRAIESIRYRSYTLAAALGLTASRVMRLQDARLYLLLPADDDHEQFARRVERLFAAGVDVVQLRDKQATDRQLYLCSKIAADIARRIGKWFIVNDRADIAAAVHASGVHLGQDELPTEAARRVLGGEALIGISTHSIEQARAAVLEGADYIGCGPTFASTTKSFDSFPGLAFLQQVASEISLPAFAIGGIDEQALDSVMQTGIHGIAVSAAILNAPDECQAATRLRQKLTQPS
ncbi:MAG: thiamine phosphate synthase [Planctomycetaceae bacterium]